MLLLAQYEWMVTRREILEQVKRQVGARLGVEPSDLKEYASAYKREFRKRWVESSKEELISAIMGAQLVYGGDFHAFSQAQRTHLRILRSLPRDREVLLGLECVESKDQALLDSFMSGKMSEKRFLQRIRWKERWGFPWENYRPIFELARSRRMKVVGLNLITSRRTAKNLLRRDHHAGQIVSKLLKKHQGMLIYVIYGDLHLASSHLPKATRERVKSFQYNEVTIFQNSERIYFELSKRDLEAHIDVVRVGKHSYCVLGAPPWVKWQSYLTYLEQNYDEDFDEESFLVDGTERVHAYVRMLARDFGVDVRGDDIEIYGPLDESLSQVLAHHLSDLQRVVAKYLVRTGQSFLIVGTGVGYLAQPTVNHVAQVAGEYFLSCLSKKRRPLWRLPHDFTPLIWFQALSFFLTKLINNRRSADTLYDLKARLSVTHPRDQGREPLMLALAQKMVEVSWIQGRASRVQMPKVKRVTSYIEAARILGAMLGEQFYHYHRAGTLSRQDLLLFLKRDPLEESFDEFYKMIIIHIGSLPSLTKSRAERL